MRFWKDDEKKFKQLINILRDEMDRDKTMEVPVVDTLCRWLGEAFPRLTVAAFRGEPPYETITR